MTFIPHVLLFDVDGTLVDTNYHHALAWYRAFRSFDKIVPVWRIHRKMGMGGDHLVADLLGEDVEGELGDDIRAAEKVLYRNLIEEVEPMDGASELIERLKKADHKIILASSGKPFEIDHYLDLLGIRDLVDGWTGSADVTKTKPDPDLVLAAIEKGGEQQALMIGDSPFDCIASTRAGIETVAVLTGGFSPEELKEAGAKEVFETLPELGDYLVN
jgi:HAD superfamily hydrolase (TIGR01549 family)